MTYDLARFLYSAIEAMRAFDERNMWWRGQADARWRLAPKIVRIGRKEEQNLAAKFKHRGSVRHHRPPSKSDLPGWLFLAQHYGLPTRLLDWTESPLVALYFACCEKDYHGIPGAVWGLVPGALNQRQMGENAIQVPGNSLVDLICGAAFNREVAQRSETHKILAIITDHFDLRHLVQASNFTVHGTDTPIDESAENTQFLVKLEIPSPDKQNLLETLEVLGIRQSQLFPDLQHLSADLVQQLRYKRT